MKALLVIIVTVSIMMIGSKVTGRSIDLSLMRSQQVDQYLYIFGYLKTKTPNAKQQQKALKMFQEATNLVATGEIDIDTLQQMGRPRCGDPDVVKEDRVRRYVLKQSRWRNTELSFGIYKWPTNSGTSMTRVEVWDIITAAFGHWENVTNIRFEGIGPETVTKEDVDIAIGWWSYAHGDDNSFDGPAWLGGQILAHSFSPAGSGDIHFDDSERWGLSTKNESIGGFNQTTFELFQVAMHEIGHSLGLNHSKDVNAVMWPYQHQDWTPKKGRSNDDIRGVQSLYGKPTGRKETVAYGTYQSNICHIVKFDAFLDNTYFFVGDKVWEVRRDYNSIVPRNITDFWEDLPGDLDAAAYNDAIFYFFKQDLVYAYGDGQNEMLYGFPKQISDVFPGFPNNLDGAFSFGNEVYFVKGDYYGKDFKQFQFPSHWPLTAPFDDVGIHKNRIKFIKNGNEFLYKDLEGSGIILSSINDLNGPQFKHTTMYATDLRYDWFQCKKDSIYDLP